MRRSRRGHAPVPDHGRGTACLDLWADVHAKAALKGKEMETP